MKGGIEMGYIVWALCLALLIEVSWKWRFILGALLTATFVVPAHMADTEFSTAATIGAIVVQTLLAIVYLVRRKLSAGVFG